MRLKDAASPHALRALFMAGIFFSATRAFLKPGIAAGASMMYKKQRKHGIKYAGEIIR
jgi:hypothetical protein